MPAGMTILLAIVAVGASATTVNRRTLLGSVAAAACTVGGSRAAAACSPIPAAAATPSVMPRSTMSLADSTVAAARVASAPSVSAATEFWSGLLAGAVQKTVKELVLHPLDTAKARLQVAGGRRSMLSGELFAAPYAGLAPALLSGAPAASAFFAVKDAVKRSTTGSLSLGKTESTLLAVACANIGYWGIKNPSEVLKVRRQAGVIGDDTLGAAVALWRTEGLGGFYQGVVPNYAYSTPVDGTKFLLYEALKAQTKARRGGAKLTALEAAVGGAAAAASAQALATPLDVARVRIITRGTDGSGNVVDTVRTIAAEEGLGALYSGVVPKVARALASGAIQFSTYEATKEWSVGVLSRSFPGL